MTGNPAMHRRQKAVLKSECMTITKFLAQFHPTMDPALKKLGFENALGLSVRGNPKLTSILLCLSKSFQNFAMGGF